MRLSSLLASPYEPADRKKIPQGLHQDQRARFIRGILTVLLGPQPLKKLGMLRSAQIYSRNQGCGRLDPNLHYYAYEELKMQYTMTSVWP